VSRRHCAPAPIRAWPLRVIRFRVGRCPVSQPQFRRVGDRRVTLTGCHTLTKGPTRTAFYCHRDPPARGYLPGAHKTFCPYAPSMPQNGASSHCRPSPPIHPQHAQAVADKDHADARTDSREQAPGRGLPNIGRGPGAAPATVMTLISPARKRQILPHAQGASLVRGRRRLATWITRIGSSRVWHPEGGWLVPSRNLHGLCVWLARQCASLS